GSGSPLDRIDACEVELTALSTEISALASDLHLLRAKGREVTELLSDHDSTIHDQNTALAQVRGEHARLQVQAATSADALRVAEERAAASDARAAMLQRELEELSAEDTEPEHGAEVAALHAVEGGIHPGETPSPGKASTNESPVAGHLRLILGSNGYRLSTSDDPCSELGTHVEIDGEDFVVARVGRSPLPSDVRRCAFLMADPA